MEIKEFKEFFKHKLEENNIFIKEKYYNDFYKYMKKIIEWNEKINVTSITDEEMFIVKHFVDSLTINKYIEEANMILDIGTGAGFPGVPLKIVNREKKFTLIDSVNKKLDVIRESVKDLELYNLEIIHSRAEDLAKKKEYREKYDVVTTRAVSNLTTILEYMLPFVKKDGYAICMKGPNIETEMKESEKALNILGGKIEKIEKITIDNLYERNIIIVKKIKNTPIQFPRNGGKPLKEPIR